MIWLRGKGKPSVYPLTPSVSTSRMFDDRSKIWFPFRSSKQLTRYSGKFIFVWVGRESYARLLVLIGYTKVKIIFFFLQNQISKVKRIRIEKSEAKITLLN